MIAASLGPTHCSRSLPAGAVTVYPSRQLEHGQWASPSCELNSSGSESVRQSCSGRSPSTVLLLGAGRTQPGHGRRAPSGCLIAITISTILVIKWEFTAEFHAACT
jgi:hypothetical protein